MSDLHGAGDRWLAGQQVAGVSFCHHDAVEIVGGAHDGVRGTIVLLIGLVPEPSYLITLGTRTDVRVKQSLLRRVTGG